MIILDTNVVSEPLKPAPDPTVLNWLDAHDPATFYLTTINLKIDGMPVQPVMVPPKSSVTLGETFSHASSVSYQTINDYGAWTPATRAALSQ